MPDPPTPEDEEAYLAVMAEKVEDFAKLGGERIAAMERCIRETTRSREGKQVNPTMLFYFSPG